MVSKQSVYKMMSRAIHRSWSFGRLCQQTQSRLMSNGEFHCRSGMFSERRIKSNFTKISHIPTLRVVRHHFQCPIKTGVLSIRSHQRECNIRCFHKSSRNQAQPFLLLMLFKSAAKMSAILSGRHSSIVVTYDSTALEVQALLPVARAFRKWWRSQPKHRSESMTETLKRNIWKIVGAFGCLCGLGSIYYSSHVELTPITNRKRFLALNYKQLSDIIEVECEQHLKSFEGLILPTSHPLYEVVQRITYCLLRGNQDLHQIQDKTWTIHVINKDVQNAFVLPNGHIFVFTGLFRSVSNEQQLGIVLAHEISHVVLNHSAEQISFAEFLDFFMIIVLGAIWAILPNDGLAVVATWFKNRVVQLLLKMPYSRFLETEADEVGLQLAAKACLDVRESQVFWESMSAKSPETEQVAFLSTHPTHSQRAKHLEDLIPQAIKVREYCNCAPLPIRDPRKAEMNRAVPVRGG